MNKTQLQQNADFLSIALEEMDPDSVEFEFVQEVHTNLLELIDDAP